MLNLKSYEIEDYLRSKGLRLRRRGQKAEAYECPFCNGGTNGDKWKFVVFLDESGGNYKCMRGSCNATGSFWQLAKHFGDDPQNFYSKSDNFRPTKTREPRKESPIGQVSVNFKSEPVKESELTAEATEYLKRRGFREEVLEDVAIWCDETGLINFGYYHKGELCMVKVRQPRKPKDKEQKAWQKWKGGLRTLWGVEQVDLSLPYLIITFGEYDRIALRQADLNNVVSVPCGDSDLEWIGICYDQLQKFTEIYLWIDNDKSGLEALPRIAERLGKDRIKVVRTEYKDANEMLVFKAKEIGLEDAEKEVFNAVANADWYYEGDLIQLCDVEEKEQSFEGYLTNLPTIDKALGGFFFGELIVHTGDTKHGKSAVLNQLLSQSVIQGAKVCIWAGEDTLESFKYKLYTNIAGYEGSEIRTSTRTGTEYAYILPEWKAKIDDFIRDKVIMLNRRAGVDETNLLENFELAFKRFGCDVFAADNLMKLVAGKDSDNTNARQQKIVNEYSDFCKSFNVIGHLVTHTKKAGDPLSPPVRDNISGAKEIINLADRVTAVWRIPESVKHEYNNCETLFSVLADRVFGNEVSVPLRYDKQVRRCGENIEAITRNYIR